MKGHPIIYPLKLKDICENDPRYLMSSGLMFYDIIMNKFRSKALQYHVKVVGSYFTKTDNNKIYMYRRGPLQDFYWKEGIHESLDVVCPYLNSVKK